MLALGTSPLPEIVNRTVHKQRSPRDDDTRDGDDNIPSSPRAAPPVKAGPRIKRVKPNHTPYSKVDSSRNTDDWWRVRNFLLTPILIILPWSNPEE